MNCLFLTLIFFSFAASAEDYSGLNKLEKKMKQTIIKAKNCLPKDTAKGGVKLCTGVHFNKSEFEYIKAMSFSRCKRQITKKFKFTLSQEIQPRHIKKEEYSRFMNSTKRAQVYYPEKLVLLKQGTGRIDCIHELLHLYQRAAKSKGPLSYKGRGKLEEKVILQLERHIKIVSSLEKKKKIKQAKMIGKKLGPYIKSLGEFKKLSNWLNEKDIYYFIYKNCAAFRCSPEDKDIALANLYKLREYFPWRTKDWLISEAAKLIKKKQYHAFKEVSIHWKPIKAVSEKEISKLLDSSLPELREKLRGENVFFISNSLFNEGVICDKDKLFILYKGELDHALLVAAALRKKQLILNPKLCAYWTDTRVTSKEFKQGAISRESYESIVLKSKMASVLSNLNIYTSLFNYQNLFPTDETSLILDRWLNAKTSSTFTVWENKLPRVFNSGMSLSFYDSNDLPMTHIHSRKLILDLGAMDSVIRPIAISTKQLKTMVVLEAKTLMTAEGRTLHAPKVMLTTPMLQGSTQMMSTRWVLADLKIIGIEGTFGLNNLLGTSFSILPSRGKLLFTDFDKKPKTAFSLQKNFRGEFDAVEFKCPNGKVVRVDTGSQVRGDIKLESAKNSYKKKVFKCGALRLKGPFESVISGGPLFSRDVVLNLGWPLLREFKKIDISLKNGWINFVR